MLTGRDFGLGERRFNLSIFNELEMTKWQLVFVLEFGNGLHSRKTPKH